MKKVLLLFTIIIAAMGNTKAQDICHADWGQWYNVYTFARDASFRISFKYLLPNKDGCIESYYRFDNPVSRPGAYLKFKFSYKKKDGTVGIEAFDHVDLDEAGLKQSNTSNWYIGYDKIRIYDIQYFAPANNKNPAISNDKPTITTDPDLGIPAGSVQERLDAKKKLLPRPVGSAMGRRADNTRPNGGSYNRTGNTVASPQNAAGNTVLSPQSAALTNGNAGLNGVDNRTGNMASSPQSAALTNSNAAAQQRRQEQMAQVKRNAEIQRQRNVEMVNRANEASIKANEAFRDGLNSIADMFTDNIIQKNLARDERNRQSAFDKLKNAAASKKGQIIDCGLCNGRGYDECRHCASRGYNKCIQCSGTGKLGCISCGGSGSMAGRTCTICGGAGKINCTYCSGRGKNICFNCSGLGREQCVRCGGSGKEFKEDFSVSTGTLTENSGLSY